MAIVVELVECETEIYEYCLSKMQDYSLVVLGSQLYCNNLWFHDFSWVFLQGRNAGQEGFFPKQFVQMTRVSVEVDLFSVVICLSTNLSLPYFFNDATLFEVVEGKWLFYFSKGVQQSQKIWKIWFWPLCLPMHTFHLPANHLFFLDQLCLQELQGHHQF